MSAPKAKILLIGSGGVGTIAALNLESSGLAAVTAVLRSNYAAVAEHGFNITSCDHGIIKNWRPSQILPRIPNLAQEPDLQPYDYILLATKNIPDIPPSLVSLITPAVTPSHTVLILLQNGLNIEHPFTAAFPNNIILSGISMIGSNELTPGEILHEDHDLLYIGPFNTPNSRSPTADAESAAKDFIAIYSSTRKATCNYDPNVLHSRWRKLVYNACLNPICAITGLDTGRIRLAGAVPGLVKPAMMEIIAAARKKGVELDDGVADFMVDVDPLELYLRPSMLADISKGNFMEIENILGEPLREGQKMGVEMPVISVLYEMGKAIQWRTKEERGLAKVPPKKSSVAVV